ncbi:MAG: single-stranded DNA-binding protein, partial [Verrucomicrobiota bacterium]|nr:single-stranded DNA-binding protein [Verrucomicrobiota bacterium]
GANVFVDGSLQVREFEPNDGSKRRRVVEVVARSVALITRIPGVNELADEQPHPEALTAQPEVEDNETAEVWPR